MSNKQTASYFKAATKGNLKKIKALLKKGTPLGAQDAEGRTILHIAAENDKMDLVKFLIEYKFNLDSQDNQGQTALYRAVIARKEAMAYFLIRSGANSDIPTKHGHTVWDKSDQYLSRSATQRMRSEAAIQRSKAPRVYYYQEPSASTAKWGDKVVSLADASGAASSSSSSSSSSSAAPATVDATPAPGSPASPQPAVAMPNIQPTAPGAPTSVTGLAPAMGRLSVAGAQPVTASPAPSPVAQVQSLSPGALSRSVDQQRAPSPQAQPPPVDPFGGSDMGTRLNAAAAGVAELESALEEMVEAMSHLALGAASVPFGDQEILLLNSSLVSFSSGLRALKRASQQVGGEVESAAQRAMQSVSGLSLVLRQINGDPGAITPYKNLGDMAKRGTHAVSNVQFSLVGQIGAETASAVQETAVATKALLQAALQPTSDIALLKSSRLAAANAINLMREVYRTMLRMGNTQGQEQVGEAGWTIGRIMEALIISAKTAYSNPQDQAARSNLAALARALAEQYHKLSTLSSQQSTIADMNAGGDESAHFAVALRQLAAASARLSSPSAPAPPPQPRERQAAALIAQVAAELNNNVCKALVEPIDPGRVIKGAREATGMATQMICMALVTANALGGQEPVLAAQINLATKTAAYFVTQIKLWTNARALRVMEPRNALGLAHAMRALAATLALFAETRLF